MEMRGKAVHSTVRSDSQSTLRVMLKGGLVQVCHHKASGRFDPKGAWSTYVTKTGQRQGWVL
jgi:hypothetical protein